MSEERLVMVHLYLYGLSSNTDVAVHCVGESDHWQVKQENRLVKDESYVPFYFKGAIPIKEEGEYRKFCLTGLTREQALAVFEDPHNWPIFGYQRECPVTCFSYQDGVWWFVNYNRHPIDRCGTFRENMFIRPD